MVHRSEEPCQDGASKHSLHRLKFGHKMPADQMGIPAETAEQRWIERAAIPLAAMILCVDLLFPLGVAIPMAYLGLVVLGLWVPSAKFTLLAAAGGSILTLVGFFYSPPGGLLWMGVANRSLAIGLLWTTAAMVILYNRARLEMKTLHGMLAVCASCKKVRDDEGFWKAMEQYVEEHSEVLFAHGLCPPCAEKWSPELDALKNVAGSQETPVS